MSAQVSQTSEGGHGDCATQQRPAPSLVTRAWNDSDGTIEDAIGILFDYAGRDKTFISEHLPALLKAWCRDEISGLVGAIRLKAWRPPNMSETGNGARLRAAFKMTLLDFPLPGGKRLGDASAQDVRDGATHYALLAADTAHKARWLFKVADAVPDDEMVSQVLTDTDLRKMQEETSAS